MFGFTAGRNFSLAEKKFQLRRLSPLLLALDKLNDPTAGSDFLGGDGVSLMPPGTDKTMRRRQAQLGGDAAGHEKRGNSRLPFL